MYVQHYLGDWAKDLDNLRPKITSMAQVGSFTLFFVPSLILLAWLRRNHCETSDVPRY